MFYNQTDEFNCIVVVVVVMFQVEELKNLTNNIKNRIELGLPKNQFKYTQSPLTKNIKNS